MKRFYLGLGILTVFLAMGLWFGFQMEGLHEELSQTLDQAAQTALAGDTTDAMALAVSAQAQWEKAWPKIAALADHSPMDEIDALFSQTLAYARAGSTADFITHCSRLARLVAAVGEAHTLTWWNLL